MGIDAGFDMVPRLTRGPVDSEKWKKFLAVVQKYYEDDEKVELNDHYIEFKAGEHPMLPRDGSKFLRFSSKVSGSIATSTGVERYIDTVKVIARRFFGSRVLFWDEYGDSWMHRFYDWRDVRRSIRDFTQETDGSEGTGHVREPEEPWYEVRTLKENGRSLLARFDIPAGTRILVEKPLFTVSNMEPELLDGIVASKLKSLSKTEQRQFLNLHNNFPGKYPFSGITKTNALPCGSGAAVGGIYPNICLINHSCLGNAHNNWNDEKGHETIHAIRPIAVGEEITISYNAKNATFTQRRIKLKESFGFECECDLCSVAESDLEARLASDTRQQAIRRLDEEIGDPVGMMHQPAAGLAKCHDLLRTLEAEYGDGAGALIPRLYYDAFQICIAHGDQARASVFAGRAYKARLECEGDDSPLTRRMKFLMKDPARHDSFAGCSKKWSSRKTAVPKGLGAAEFEQWLWRVQR